MRWKVAPHVGFYALLAAHQPAVVCDIGSFDGQQARRFKRICPNAKVVAFEANPDRQIRAPGVVVEHLAVSDKPGTVDFHAVEDYPQQSSLLDRLDRDAVTTAPVDAVRLDDYLADTTGPVALWIDVEGAAAQVLEGAAGLRHRIVAIHVELEGRGYIWNDQPNAPAVLERLRGWGFVPVGSAPVQQARNQYDYLLVRDNGARTRLALTVTWLDTLTRRLLPGQPWPVRALAVVAASSALSWTRHTRASCPCRSRSRA